MLGDLVLGGDPFPGLWLAAFLLCPFMEGFGGWGRDRERESTRSVLFLL